ASFGGTSQSFSALSWLEFLDRLPGALQETFLITAAVAMAIGLVQQVAYLSRQGPLSGAVRHAVRIAIFWRLAVSVLMSAMILLWIAQNQGLISPDGLGDAGWDYSSYPPLVPECLLYLGMIVGLSSLLGRRRSSRMPRALRAFLIVIAGLFAIVAQSQETGVIYLVYRAMAGIEQIHASQFRRPGAYPDFAAEGHWLFWRSAIALLASRLGAWLLLSAVLRTRLPVSTFIWTFTWGSILLSGGAAFGYWFLLAGLGQIAPDFAEGGWASTPRQWIEAALACTLAIPFLAVGIVGRSAPRIDIGDPAHPYAALHQSRLVSIVLALSSLIYVVTLVLSLGGFGWSSLGLIPWEVARWTLFNAGFYIPTAVALLGFQRFGQDWRHGSSPEPMRIVALDARRFIYVCAAFVMIAVFSVPTLFAFSFASWFSPWS
ncbi:MAG: hypothetical protein AAF961_07905, partial [Planctomycetota bacterium]